MLTRNFRFRLPMLALAALTYTAFAQSPSSVTFTSPQQYNTGPEPAWITSGDFNEDGKPDLAVLDAGSNTVQILLNNGDGTFRLGSQIATGMNPTAIVAGNFNNDAHQDIAVANSDRTLTIAIGAGDGTFPVPGSFPTTGIAAAMIGSNLINDGLTQLVTVECATQQTAPCALNVYQSDGHALFGHSLTVSLPLTANQNIFPNLIATDDFNLDNKSDIAVGTDTKVLVFKNTSVFNGTGNASLTLSTTITPPNTSKIDGLVAGHFNTGAAPDIAISVFQNVSDTNFPQSVYSYLNTGSGTFFLKNTVPTVNSFSHALAVGDVNGDGIQDLIYFGTSIKTGGIDYALGRGDGTFIAPKATPANFLVNSVIVRDLNLDSRHDIGFTSNNPLAGTHFGGVMLNANAITNCAPPGSATLAVKFCAATPSTNALSVKASGNSQNGVKRVELWVDGSKKAQAFSDQLNVKVGIAAGTHSVTVVGVDLYDKLVKSTISVKVP